MKISTPVDLTDYFKKTVETSDDIIEGTAKLFYPDTDKLKVADLPVPPNAYLEIERTETEPVTPEEGEMYYNPTTDTFYLYAAGAWVEGKFLFSGI